MDLGLRGRCAFVGASSKGLGFATAAALLGEAARVVITGLERSSQARIVLIGGTSIKQPMDDLVLSNSVRAAVAGLAKPLANELGEKGIPVNSVCPGAIDTDRIRSLGRSQAEKRGESLDAIAAERNQSIPLGRMDRPEEVGDVVAFLGSGRASHITGTVLQIDGGATRSGS